MTPADLRAALPGTWHILATTFPLWLSGKRLRPTISYAVLPGDDLVLADDVSYETRSGGRRHILGIDRYETQTGDFVWRGRGVLGLLTSRWKVHWLSPDGETAVLTFSRSRVTPAGIDVIGRTPGRPSPYDLGLTDDQRTLLTWI